MTRRPRLAAVALGAVAFLLGAGGPAFADTTVVTVVTVPAPVTTAAPVPTTLPSRLTTPTAVTITGPQSGDTVVNTALQISGTAPPDLLVSVSILDTGGARGNVAQQPSGRIDGSVTSVADGSWVFVPQLRVVPGSYAVTASYRTGQGQTIASPAVPFTVVNVSGESAVASSSLKWKVALTLLFLALVITGGVVVYRRRRWEQTGVRPPASPLWPTWWQARRDRGRDEMQRYVSFTSGPADTRAANPDSLYPDSQPLFMNTVVGRSFQRDQVKKLHEMDDKVKGVERALAGTAEALELSYSTITALRHQILDELTASEPDQDDDPFAPRRT